MYFVQVPPHLDVLDVTFKSVRKLTGRGPLESAARSGDVQGNAYWRHTVSARAGVPMTEPLASFVRSPLTAFCRTVHTAHALSKYRAHRMREDKPVATVWFS